MLVFSFTEGSAANFPHYLTDSDGLRLLKGEKNISILFRQSADVDQDFITSVNSDLELKFRMIGQEPKPWEYPNPYLLVELYIA